MLFADLTLLDWFICITLLICCALGFVRGFIKELILLTVWALSFLIAQLLRNALSAALEPYIQTDYLQLIALSIIFLICVVIGSLFVKFITYPASNGLSGLISKILGTLFGIIKTAVIILVALRIGTLFDFQQSELYTQSKLVYLFNDSTLWLNAAINHLIDALLAVNPITTIHLNS